MKMLLCASAAGLLLMLPGISVASQVDFVSSGSQCTLFFDPCGSGNSDLPSPCYYRSYDCRIGSKPTLPDLVITKYVHIIKGSTGNHDKGTGGTNPGTTGTTGDTGTSDNPVVTNPVVTPPVDSGVTDGTTAASVPLPAPLEMAGAGVAATMLFSWLRSRRHARA
ncbi:MAG: hypothetical protein ABSH08_02940 [Tepidisphaeraceae bacterium]|jgi:hypothetical protein